MARRSRSRSRWPADLRNDPPGWPGPNLISRFWTETVKRDHIFRGQPAILRSGVVALAAGVVAATGCGRSSPDRLVVATTWPAAVCRRLDSEFLRWVDASHDHLGHRRFRLEWLNLGPDDDLVKVASQPRTAASLASGGTGVRASFAYGSTFTDRSRGLCKLVHRGTCWDRRRDGSFATTAPLALTDFRGDPARWAMRSAGLPGTTGRNGHALLVRRRPLAAFWRTSERVRSDRDSGSSVSGRSRRGSAWAPDAGSRGRRDCTVGFQIKSSRKDSCAS